MSRVHVDGIRGYYLLHFLCCVLHHNSHSTSLLDTIGVGMANLADLRALSSVVITITILLLSLDNLSKI